MSAGAEEDPWARGPCAALEECAFCVTRYGPPKCSEFCYNYTLITKSSMLDAWSAAESEQCSGFREKSRCFLRWTLYPQRAILLAPHPQRCTGDPTHVVGLVACALLTLGFVLALGLGLPMRLWHYLMRTRPTGRSSFSRASTRSRPSRTTAHRSDSSRSNKSKRSNSSRSDDRPALQAQKSVE